MSDPVLVEVTRGAAVESRHRGAVAVSDAAGGLVLALGDVAAPVFPRSAVKAFQALPLVESGAADRYGLDPADLALACASHSGEPAHVARAGAMLAKAGRDAGCLECGAHWPLGEAAARDLARHGQPTALHNNCSGKHAGFVCLACHSGADVRGYVRPDHPVQKAGKAAIAAMTGADLDRAPAGTDGCSIPTYAVPLAALARGFARFGAGEGLDADRAAACARIRAAVAAHPDMVAGTKRFDTDVMTALGSRAFTKTGAEGVFCAALPELGLGVAIKADDGGTRAAETMMAAVVARFLPLSASERAALEGRISPVLKNWNGIVVGAVRAVAPLAAATD